MSNVNEIDPTASTNAFDESGLNSKDTETVSTLSDPFSEESVSPMMVKLGKKPKPKKKVNKYISPDVLARCSSRERHVIQSCGLFQQYLNMGDLESIHKLVDEFFLHDVSIYTSAMNVEETGAERVKEYFVALTTSYPDLVLILKSTRYNPEHGVASMLMYGVGTSQFHHRSDYMVNAVLNTNSTSIEPELREKAVDIVNTGGVYQCSCKVHVHCVFNPERTHIQKFILIQKVLDVIASPQF